MDQASELSWQRTSLKEIVIRERYRGVPACLALATLSGPKNQYIYFQGAVSGTVYRLRALHPGLNGPGGVRLSVQP